MEKELLVSLEWDKVRGTQNYLYGSRIDFHEQGVRFFNPYLASGKAIKTYHSQTNYQGLRIHPELPVLEPGANYLLYFDLPSVPENRIYLEFDCRDRQGQRLQEIIIRYSGERFTFPEQAYTYRLMVRSAGCQSVDFHSIKIYKEKKLQLLTVGSAPAKSLPLDQLPSPLHLVAPLLDTKDNII